MEDKEYAPRPTHPRNKASLLSKITFFYTIPMFYRALKKEFDESDFTETLTECKTSELGQKLEISWMQEVKKARKNCRKPHLVNVLWTNFKWTILFHAVLSFSVELSRLIRPLLLRELLRYFSKNDISKNNATIYAAGILGCTLVEVSIIQSLRLSLIVLGIKMRNACSHLIYQKSLQLRKSFFNEEISFGYVVNLLCIDAARFDRALRFAHYIWITPLEVLICTYFMYNQVGDATFIGMSLMVLLAPLQVFLGYLCSKIRSKVLVKTDERVRFIHEVISGIQVIKMNAWEKSFEKLISCIRRQELKLIRVMTFVKLLINTFMIFAARASSTCTILAFAHFQYEISSENVFVVLLIYNVLRISVSILYGLAAIQLAEMKVSIDRINKFLIDDEEIGETFKYTSKIVPLVNNLKKLPEKKVFLKNVCVKRNERSNRNTLNNISFSTREGKLFAVVGPVGAGKSSLLEVLLKELIPSSGSVHVEGKISYSPQEPWIFSKSLRQNILFGSAYNEQRYKHAVKVCALERDFSLLPNGDLTVVGVKAVNLSGGQKARINLCRAVYKEADIYLLDEPFAAVDNNVGQQIFNECIKEFLSDKIVILVTHHLQYIKEASKILYLNEGELLKQGSFEELQDMDFIKLAMGRNKKDDPEVEKRINTQNFKSSKKVEESRAVGSVNKTVFRYYINASGNWYHIFMLSINIMLIFFLCIGNDYFFAYWVDLEESRLNRSSLILDPESFWNFSRETSMNICIALIVAIIIASLVFALLFPQFGYRASNKIHDQMFRSIVRTTIRFFTDSNSGQILNRFSKDLTTVDDIIPNSIAELLNSSILIFGILVLVSLTNPFLLFPTIILVILFEIIRKIYITASTSIKRLEKISYSPFLNHISDSLQGLPLIRAFNAENLLITEFEQKLDLYNSVRLFFFDLNSAFCFFLDVIALIYIIFITFSFLIFDIDQTAAKVGLAITQVLALTGYIQWGLNLVTELQNFMTSVERVKEYSNLESEGELEVESQKPPPSWPERGRIEFQHVELKYSDNDLVLKDINFVVEPQEKMGIIGRTGAGKSSLMNALLQMIKVQGKIFVDNIDLSQIGLHDLRRKISVIPQDTVLFSGTLRYNLDPFNNFSDAELWEALEEVNLKDVVNKLTDGLYYTLSENGGNFSVGERQLLSLARIILRNNKILILDEATANIDLRTDKLLQETIKRRFAHCTVLTIAHRVNTILDSDKILVLDAGKIIEYGSPNELLENKDSYFSKMVN